MGILSDKTTIPHLSGHGADRRDLVMSRKILFMYQGKLQNVKL